MTDNDAKDFVISNDWGDEGISRTLSNGFKESIKTMKKKEKTENIEVLIFVSVASSIYILTVLSALSTFLREVFHENKEATIKINFLLLPKIIKDSESIRESFIKHNEKNVPKIEEHEERLTSLIKITSSNFMSMVNTVLLGLEGYKEKKNDMICNYINFVDIDDYYEEDEILRKKIKEVVEKIGIPDEWEQAEEIIDIVFNSKYNVFEEIMNSIIYSVTATKAEKIVIIESKVMTKHIKTFFEEYDSKLKKDLEMIHYSEPPPLTEMLFYLNILSRYFNEGKSINDEFYFANVLKTLDSESIFAHKNLREIYDAPGTYIREFIDPIKDEKRKLSEVEEDLKRDPGNERYINERKKMETKIEKLKDKRIEKQKVTMKNINDGFIDIQESIIFQLGLMI